MLAFYFGSLYSPQHKNAIQLRQVVVLVEGLVKWDMYPILRIPCCSLQ